MAKQYDTEITNERINQYLERETGTVLILDIAGHLLHVAKTAVDDDGLPDEQLRKSALAKWDALRLASTGFTVQRNAVIDQSIKADKENARRARVEALRAYYEQRDENGEIITPW